MKNIFPSAPAVIREAVIVIGGAILAAAVMSQFPGLKTWIKEQWN